MAVAVVVMGILAISGGLYTYASPSTTCKTVQKGATTELTQNLNIHIPKGRRKWDFHIPRVCKENPAVGLKVSACDFDAPPYPSLQIRSLDMVRLKRYAYHRKGGALLITVYCGKPWTAPDYSDLVPEYDDPELGGCNCKRSPAPSDTSLFLFN